MVEHTFNDLIQRVRELKESGSSMDMIIVQAPGSKKTDIFIGKVGDNLSIDFSNSPIFGYFKIKKFKEFCLSEGLTISEEKWENNRVIRAAHEPNEYTLVSRVRKYFSYIHNLEGDYPIKITCMGWESSNNSMQSAADAATD